MLFPGSVETDVGRGGNLKSRSMASGVRNICAKNCQKPLILLKVTIDDVGMPFWDTVNYKFPPYSLGHKGRFQRERLGPKVILTVETAFPGTQ